MHSVPVTFRPLNTIRMSLKSANDPIDPKDMKVVYIIPCSCGTPYIGEMGRSISQRISEHAADLKHRRSKSSALAEHAEKNNYHVCIKEASVIARVSQFHHRKFREAPEIEKRPCNLNREDGWKISRCWVPTLFLAAFFRSAPPPPLPSFLVSSFYKLIFTNFILFLVLFICLFILFFSINDLFIHVFILFIC